MRAVITVEMDNAALEDSGSELAELVSKTADKIAEDYAGTRLRAGDRFGIRDSNDNIVGSFKVED